MNGENRETQMKRKGQLHQLLAVEGDLMGRAKLVLGEATNTFKGKHDLFTGYTKTVKMIDEDRQGENTESHQAMSTTVRDKLEYVRENVVDALDALLQKDATNQQACADLIVDNKTIGYKIPATSLLSLEKRLQAIKEMCLAIPTLKPGVHWEKDEAAGVYRDSKPDERFKTEKRKQFIETSPATKEHKAQVSVWDADVNVGKIVQQNVSGMLTPVEKAAMLKRIEKLVAGAKDARARANCTPVVDARIGESIFDYILQK